ncbi:MAG: polysaccharide deacetylase family protein, partial [Akkermansia sp.]|nr:polysaccharide deacetylase family protein [Akkermansia sp.]
MRLLAYLTTVMLLSHTAVGQLLDPPPLDLNPLIGGTPTTEGTTQSVSQPRVEIDTPDITPVQAQPVTTRDRFRGDLVAKEKTRVAVLGYHNFSETKSPTRMLLRTSELRKQMETIRQNGYTVISMQEFLEWRLGERLLPEKCVLITLDDGWRSVYTDAYPIFKEYGYPFHLFLYTRYLTGRGDSMSPAMIREMMDNGATIGSHSATHPYPSTWKKHERAGQEAYVTFIDKEIGESRTRLEQLFGPVNTYCYPGGYNDETMVSRMAGYGYVAAFTVIPHKVSCNVDPMRIDRYMVFGTDASIFRSAIDFRGSETRTAAAASGAQPGL